MVVAHADAVRTVVVRPVHGFCIEFSNRSIHLYAVLRELLLGAPASLPDGEADFNSKAPSHKVHNIFL